MLSKIIYYSFAVLLFFTPFVWHRANFELFEYNKMMLVYGLTTIITTSWILKMITLRSLILKKTPLDLPLMFFLLANILSTIFSIDQHTSIWGYYSRSNGGLLSIISYTLLFYAFVSNIDKDQTIKLLKTAILGGVLIALYGIWEHFGVSMSCFILLQELTDSCWVQDVQARVFATLGQPNWLAAYLEMLIFPCIYFAMTATSKLSTLRYIIYSILLYLAFTFTYSRGGMLGFVGGLAVLLTVLILLPTVFKTDRKKSIFSLSYITQRLKLLPNKKILASIILLFIIINLSFGSALTRFQLFSNFAPPARPALLSNGTQLENGGTESGRIRLIVWKGAVEIFKHYPIFGSGVETFAYSYYNFRPLEHNLVSEWDFLYNKAHNEYLNYLATTGIVGFISYLALIGTFIYWSVKTIILKFNSKTKKDPDLNIYSLILVACLLASYTAYLIQNFFGFSVVIIALFFFIFPAIAFTTTESVQNLSFKDLRKNLLIQRIISFRKNITNSRARQYIFQISLSLIYAVLIFIFNINFWLTWQLFLLLLVFSFNTEQLDRLLSKKYTLFLVAFMGFFVLLTLSKLWLADTKFAEGENDNTSGNPGAAFNELTDAVKLNKNEPFYRSEIGYAAAASSNSLKDIDATLSAELKDQAIYQTVKALTISPRNVSYWKTAFRTYLQLSDVDPKFNQITIDTIDQALKLAPTDPKLQYQKGLILYQIDRLEEAQQSLEKTLLLKNNYREAYITLAQVLFKLADMKKDDGQKQVAVATIKKVLEFIPNDPEVLSQLNDWGQQGVATESGKETK
jgi:putative inorganic carbon (hco3(-)) transporter